MSSATSTETVLPHREVKQEAKDDGFRLSHFFVLLSLVAATVAVMLARPSAPENLILISLAIGAAGLAAILFYRTVAPLLDSRAEEDRMPLNMRLRADLEREKALTLRSIKELEFDRAMGKVSEQDFDQMAGRLRARAMGIMKQLEAGSAAYRQEIERELAARIGSSTSAKASMDTSPSAKAPVDKPDVTPDRQCACGTANDADAKFCKHCGAKLTAEAHA